MKKFALSERDEIGQIVVLCNVNFRLKICNIAVKLTSATGIFRILVQFWVID
jgi:hypothetical protein